MRHGCVWEQRTLGVDQHNEMTDGNSKPTLIEFFERERLRLGYKEKNEDEADHVPSCVPTEGTLWSEGAEKTGEGDGDDEVAENEESATIVETVAIATYKNHRTEVDNDIPTSRTYMG